MLIFPSKDSENTTSKLKKEAFFISAPLFKILF